VKIVVKYGGSAMGTPGSALLLKELAGLVSHGHSVVLVHGGGPEIDAALAAQALETVRIEGLRVTDRRALDVVESVLCGTLNKRIVRDCLAAGIDAVGLSGQDGSVLRARAARASSGADLGYVGEIAGVNPRLLLALLREGFTPVVAPVAISFDCTHALNVNADTSAGAIAAALQVDAFVILTDVPRVLRDPKDPSSGIEAFSVQEARGFSSSPGCQQSMRPKILAAADAVAAGVSQAYICAAGLHAVRNALTGDATVVRA